jgi:hypothetical protein
MEQKQKINFWIGYFNTLFISVMVGVGAFAVGVYSGSGLGGALFMSYLLTAGVACYLIVTIAETLIRKK